MKIRFLAKVFVGIIFGIPVSAAVLIHLYSWVEPIYLMETTNIAGFRYQMYFHDQVLADTHQDLALEMHCYAYEYRFPYLYAYGESGYTKIRVIPLFTKIEKIENHASDKFRRWSDGPSRLTSNLKHLRKRYKSDFILIENMGDVSVEDKKIFLQLRQQGEEMNKWWRDSAKEEEEKRVFDELDRISNAMEESLKKQEHK